MTFLLTFFCEQKYFAEFLNTQMILLCGQQECGFFILGRRVFSKNVYGMERAIESHVKVLDDVYIYNMCIIDS